MKYRKTISAVSAAAAIVNMFAAVSAAEPVIDIDFRDETSVSDWSNSDGITFSHDDVIGDYALIDGNSAASAPRSPEFSVSGDVCVEFDMMIPTNKADGMTANTIGGGATGGLALMEGDSVAGVVGFRGNSTGTPDHIISTGGTKNTTWLLGLASPKSTAYRDQWLHYVMVVNTDTDKGDIYIIDPEDEKVYNNEGTFTSYIKNIGALTNIGVVSDTNYTIGLANLKVYEPDPNKVELSAVDDVTVQYLPGEGSVSTVQYTSKALRTLGYNSGGEYIQTDQSIVMDSAVIDYSVTTADGETPKDGISIGSDGILEITSQAEAGEYIVTARCGELTAELPLEVKEAGLAVRAEISGNDEIILGSGTEYAYKVLPVADTGAVLPDKDVTWEIIGNACGCSINDEGVLTVGNETGKITLKAVIDENGVSQEFDVYIRSQEDIENAPVEIKGMLLSSGGTDISSGTVSGAAIKSDTEGQEAHLCIRGYDKYGLLTVDENFDIGILEKGAYSVDIASAAELEGTVKLRAMIIGENEKVLSGKTVDMTEGIYKGLPIVGDWYMNEEVGIGASANSGPPAGIDPEVVNTSEHSASYKYDDNYREITKDNILWYKTGAYYSGSNIYQQHSRDWEQQALPIGNGYMGGMIFGMPGRDQIQFNEETFWAGGYRGIQTESNSSTINPDMGEGINSYMNAGNIFVDFGMPKNAEVRNYYRDLDLDEAVAHVEYTYNNVKYNREYFASYKAESLIFRYTADTDGALTFDVNPVMAHPGNIKTEDGVITITGKLKDSEPYSSGGNVRYAMESDLEYCAKIKVIADGGEVIDDYAKISVKDANAVTIIVTCATDYDPDQFEIGEDGKVDIEAKQFKHRDGVEYAVSKAETRLANTDGKSYEELKNEHIEDYKSLFDRVKFTLTDDDEICKTPTNELLSSYGSVVSQTTDSTGASKVTYDQAKYDALDKHAEELYYNYSRYLMIASSRENTIPANLQGKWCQSVSEIWGSGYTLNINLEMNYWFAGEANLTESAMALIGWLESQIPAGSVTAKNQYGITQKSYRMENGKVVFEESENIEDRPFIMHTKSSILGSTDITGSMSIQSPGNLAWLMQNVWNIYETSGDVELLRTRLYPIMRQAANFYTQYMYSNKRTTDDTEKYPNGYYYTTGSSRSPEQGPTQEGIYYDLQLVAGFYDYIIEAANILGTDKDKLEVWHEIRDNIKKPVELGDDGQVKEWEQETAYNRDENGNKLGDDHHRHISNLVALYPGELINRDTPEFMEGARIVLNNRGDDSTGWSCSFKFLLWGRLLDGDRALELFRYQIAKKTYSNLFNFHDPFQIDGNFGSAAGIHELVMQSEDNDIYILPALPSQWDKGSISGIKSKNGSEVSIEWAEGKLTQAEITPIKDCVMNIGYGDTNLAVTADGVTTVVAPVNGLCSVAVTAGKTYSIAPTEAEADKDMYTVEGSEKQDGTCKITVSKNSDAASDGHMMYIACYKDGVPTSIKAIDISSLSKGQEDYTIEYGNADSIKVFFWNSKNIPVSSQVTL